MSDEPAKKIIIDEDWKSQVQAEKEAAQAAGGGPQGGAEAGAEPPMGPLPPPSLTLLATSLAFQAMIGLGAVANPATGKAELHLDQAKHFVDTIDLLQRKTEGNRTPEESEALDGILHELRMLYVHAAKD